MTKEEIIEKLEELDGYIKLTLKEIFGDGHRTVSISVHDLTKEQIKSIDKKPTLNHVERGAGNKVHYFTSSGINRGGSFKTTLYYWSFYSKDWKPTKCNKCHCKCDCHK